MSESQDRGEDLIKINLERTKEGIIKSIRYIKRGELLPIFKAIRNRVRRGSLRLTERLKCYLHYKLTDPMFFKAINLEGLELVKRKVKRRDWNKAKFHFISHLKKRKDIQFFFSPSERDEMVKRIKELFPHSISKTIKEADFLLEKGEIDWHSNFMDERRWPNIYFRNIDYKSNKRIGDIRTTWEVNRHTHFITLGKAYWYTNKEKYAERFRRDVFSWIDKNPIYKGINWISSMEVSIRCINWIWAYYYFCDWLPYELQIEFLKYLLLQIRFVRSHLSSLDRGVYNNHLIAEAAGLVIAGILFPEFKEAKEWRNTGFKVLEEEIKRQVLQDGVHFELSTGYHLQVVNYYLLVVILAKRNNIPIPHIILKRLEEMLEFIEYTKGQNGELPNISDSDNGKGACFLLNLGAVLFKRRDMKMVASGFEEDSFWLLGEEGLREFERLSKEEPIHLSRVFEESGFIVMRSDWSERNNYSLFIIGSKDLSSINYGHRHADLLSFELHVNGIPLIIDPGTYTYSGDEWFRRYFRGTHAHNTLVIDNKDQFEFREGPFGIRRIANIKEMDVFLSENIVFFETTHNGYSPILHKRQVFFIQPDYWVINDLVTGEGEHTLSLFFHFAPETKVKFLSNDIVKINKDKANMLISSSLNPKPEIIEGWVSPYYGMKVKAPVLKYTKRCYLPKEFTTILYPFTNAPEISLSSYGPYLKIGMGDKTDYFIFQGSDSFDGKVGYIRKDNKGEIKRLWASSFSIFKFDSIEILKSIKKIDKIEIDWNNEAIKIIIKDRTPLSIYGPGVESVIVNKEEVRFNREGEYLNLTL